MLSTNHPKPKGNILNRIGAYLPESNVLFVLLTLLTILASSLLQGNYSYATHTGSYQVINFISADGARWIISHIITNFVTYPALGVAIITVIGFGFAEKVGLLGALIKAMGSCISDKFILFLIIFIGINSSIASSAGYVVLIPLSGALYAGLGKNPILGIAVAFVSVAAGFGANLFPTPGDAILGSITENVIQQLGKTLNLHPSSMNLFFMMASTFFLIFLISFITHKFVAKRANRYSFTLPSAEIIHSFKLTPLEKKALKLTLWNVIFIIIFLIFLYKIGSLSPYIDENGRNIYPLLDNIIVIMVMLFLFPAITYGIVIGKIRSTDDYMDITVEAIQDIAYIIVFSVFAGNFLGIFNHSGLSTLISNSGAHLLITLKIHNAYLLLILFILLSAFINLFIGSASAKWVLLAPTFIPMLMSVSGDTLSPEAIQAAYRIADSATNIITPLMPYLGYTLVFMKRYNKNFELSDMITLMMPYSIYILIGWSLFFMLWYAFKIPFGL